MTSIHEAIATLLDQHAQGEIASSELLEAIIHPKYRIDLLRRPGVLVHVVATLLPAIRELETMAAVQIDN